MLASGVGGCTRQHDAELVTAQARNRVTGANRRGQAFGDDAQELVTVAMAERVVHFLEAVEIHHHQCDVGAEPARGGQRRRYPIGVQRAVREPGQ